MGVICECDTQNEEDLNRNEFSLHKTANMEKQMEVFHYTLDPEVARSAAIKLQSNWRDYKARKMHSLITDNP